MIILSIIVGVIMTIPSAILLDFYCKLVKRSSSDFGRILWFAIFVSLSLALPALMMQRLWEWVYPSSDHSLEAAHLSAVRISLFVWLGLIFLFAMSKKQQDRLRIGRSYW